MARLLAPLPSPSPLTRRCLITALVLAAAASAAHVASAQAPGADAAGEVRVRFHFPPPAVTKGPDGPDGRAFHHVAIEGLDAWGAEGEPILPRRLARIVLGPGATAAGVDVVIGSVTRLPGTYRVGTAHAEGSPLDGVPPAAAAARALTGAWPASPWELLGVGFLHGRAVATLSLAPLRYFPETGALELIADMEVVVRTAPLDAPARRGVEAAAAASRGRLVLEGAGIDLSPARLRELEELGDNPAPEHQRRTTRRAAVAAPEDSVVYAVVTSPLLAVAFEPLVAARAARGVPSRLYTTDWIFARFDGLRPDGAEDDATRLRNFITDLYLNQGLRYVLLGGDADGSAECAECEPPIVPVRRFQSRAPHSEAIPADMYYGCLDGTFDGDADGAYGEPNDGPGGGDVDFLFEVHVGRAPVDSLAEAESFVRKTLAYERSSGPVLRSVLFAGEYLGFGGEYDFGGTLSEQVRLGSNEFISTVGFDTSPYREFFTTTTLYDREARWTPEALVGSLENGVHILNHIGHADVSSVLKLTNADIDALHNRDPFVGYTQSCFAGAFDNQRTHGAYGDDSVVEHLLGGPAGAVAFIANSRRGWAGTGNADGPSQRFNRRFWDVVLRTGVLELGRANDLAKEASLAYIQANERARWCAYELNVLGDPLLALKLASRRGHVSLGRDRYNPGDRALLTLIDADLDLASDEVDVASVPVRALGSGDVETVMLRERGPGSGVFEAFVEVSQGAPVSGDGVLQAARRDVIRATYADANDGAGGAAVVEAEADVATPVVFAASCPGSGARGTPFSGQLRALDGAPPYRFRTQEGYREELRDPFYQGIGYGQGWTADDSFWALDLPFPFPFYGRTYELVYVSSNGYIELGSGDARDFSSSVEKLVGSTRIAVLWADLVTSGAGDIYIRDQADSVTIRWAGESYRDGENANAEIELSSDGRIRFGYGEGNTMLSPTIGISAGDGINYVVSALNGREQLSQGPSAHFLPSRLPAGLMVDAESGVLSGTPQEVFSGDVIFRVEDALAQTAQLDCRLEIFPDGIFIVAPATGALPLLRASEQPILWDFIGSVGAHLRIDFNTSGSETEFPFPITASTPIEARGLSWMVPNLSTPRARLRLASVERPEFFAVSDVFSISGPSIVLTSPNGGEMFIAGDNAVVSWQLVGDTGPEVRIDYNTDGSMTSFPLVLADSAPNQGFAIVMVPPTYSANCRLRVQSRGAVMAHAVSAGVFSIQPPFLRLTAPNGGECLRAGVEYAVSWIAAGPSSQEVRLEYNTDGSPDQFPFAVHPDPVPNSGIFLWTVPFTTSARSRLRVSAASGAPSSDASDGVFSIDRRCALRVLVWVPFVEPDDEQVSGSILALELVEPDAEHFFSTATTPEALRSELDSNDAMLVPRQKFDFGPDFEALGRELAPVLEEFLARGGALAVAEQTSRSEAFVRASGLLDFQRIDRGARLCEVIAPSHPVAFDVRPNFGGPISTSWYDITTRDAVSVVAVGPGQTVVAARDMGFGRVTLLGFDYYSFNRDTARLLANALKLELPAGGLSLTRPRAGGVFFSGQTIDVEWFALGEARGPAEIRSGTAETPDSFPFVVGIGETEENGFGRFSWRAPSPPEGQNFLTVRLEVHSLAAPSHRSSTPQPIFIVRPLEVATAALPQAAVGVPYTAALDAAGGAPPYTFTVNNLPPGFVVEDAPPLGALLRGLPQAECPNCEVEVVVTDTSGLEARRFLPLEIVRREIRVLDPSPGEIVLFGSPFELRWRTSGPVGKAVSVHWNRTGSAVDFPELITDSAPIGEPFVWSVPPITADRCRLLVRSNEEPEIAGASGVFSIVAPTVRIESPNGGECWTPGGVRRIRWRSVGNTTGLVRIAFNTGGSDSEFPFLVAQGLPPTGEYLWNLPDVDSETCRVEVRFDNVPEIRDASDETFRIGPHCGASVLVWSPCPGVGANADVFRAALESRYSEVSIVTSESRSPAELATLAASREAVVVLLMSICQTLDYERLGRDMEPFLGSYVRSGGVVVLCAPNSISSRLLAGLGLLDRLRLLRTGGGFNCQVNAFLHPIVQGLPLEFTGPFSTLVYQPVASRLETLVASGGDAVLSAADDGSGRWVLLGFNFQLANNASERLAANSVRMLPQRDGLRVLSPLPRQVLTSGSPVRVEWAARGTRNGTVEIHYGRQGDDPLAILVASVPSGETGGRFDWTAPAPPPGDYLALELGVRWADDPAVSARSEGPFFVVESQLGFTTTELPAARLFALYRAEIEATGGVEPYSFDWGPLPAGLNFVPPDASGGTALVTGTPLETVTDFPFRLAVRDAIGSQFETLFTLRVLPSRLILRSPRGGERILAGSTHRVEWEVRGNAGQTVRIEYNLSGSTAADSFIHVAALAAPVTEPFLWAVPAEPSERCRMRIRSNENGLESTSESSFAISPPGITLLTPNGGEALDTDSERTLRWRSLGNPSGEVEIEIIDDDAPERSVVLAAAAPDNGEMVWRLPAQPPCTACRVRVSSTADAALSDASDAPFAIRPYNPVRGLVWVPYTSHAELEVRGAIAAISTFEHDFDWRLSAALTLEALEAELRGRESLLVVQQLRRPDVSFASRGADLGPVLEDFVTRGGTVVVLKQIGSGNDFLPATRLLVAREAGSAFDAACGLAERPHPVTIGVSPTFHAASATSWYDLETEGADVYADHDGAPVAIGRDIGDGRVVLIGFDYRDYTPDSARLLANAVRMSPVRGRAPFVRGDVDASGRIDIADAARILLYLFAGAAEPPCLDAADVDDSAGARGRTPAVNVTDAVHLLGWLYLGTRAPAPPAPTGVFVLAESCGLEASFRDGLGCSDYSPCD